MANFDEIKRKAKEMMQDDNDDQNTQRDDMQDNMSPKEQIHDRRNSENSL